MANIFDWMDRKPGMLDVGRGANIYGESARFDIGRDAQFAGEPVERGLFSYLDDGEPKMPNLSSGQSDVSGFASFGMEPPEIPDPMEKIRGIMAMVGDPQKRREAQPMQQGGLMAYLQQLGVV